MVVFSEPDSGAWSESVGECRPWRLRGRAAYVLIVDAVQRRMFAVRLVSGRVHDGRGRVEESRVLHVLLEPCLPSHHAAIHPFAFP